MRNNGDQSIAGALTVSSLQIGTWTLSQAPSGDLAISSPVAGSLALPSLVGTVMMWSGSIAAIPPAWALCDGKTVGGVITPDLRDRFVVGAGQSYSPGETGGANNVTLTTDEMPAHSHGFPFFVAVASGPSNNANVPAAFTQLSLQTDPAGGGLAHENRPPYYALAYIVRVA